jgi:hypothetical protein
VVCCMGYEPITTSALQDKVDRDANWWYSEVTYLLIQLCATALISATEFPGNVMTNVSVGVSDGILCVKTQ